MFHLAANTLLLGTVADTDVPAVTDDQLTITNNHLVLPKSMALMAAQFYSPLLDRVKIASPTMRQIATPYIRPIGQGTAGVTNPNICLWDNNPYQIPPFEEIQVQATSTIGAGTERFTGGLWLADGIDPLPAGAWTPLRFTSTTAAVANAWTSITLIWTDALPAGWYAMVLSEVISATGQFHRWLVSNQFWRPGYPSFVNAASRHPYAMSKGQFGLMGKFRSNDLPRLQVLCNGTDAVHTGYLSVVRLGAIS